MVESDIVIDLDAAVERVYRAVLRPGDACVDAGAHVGRHTFPMAEIVGLSGVVYAFEPEPSLAQGLTGSLPCNVRFHQSALADSCGTSTFVRVADDLAYSGLRVRRYPGPRRLDLITVATETIDSVCLHGHPVRFLKIDVECGEYHVLLGARAVLEKCHPVFFMEHGMTEAPGFYGYDHADFERFLKSFDYEIFGFDEQGQCFPGFGDGHCWNFICTPKGVDAAELMLNITARPENIPADR